MALSFGRAPSSVLLGSPLSYRVPLRLEPGESVTPQCVDAVVQVGERRLLPGDAQVSIEPGPTTDERVLRVTTTAAMDEPVVVVTVTVGCNGRSSRRYTAFADPPGMQVTPPVVAETAPASPAPAAPLAPAATSAPAVTGTQAGAGSPRAVAETGGARLPAPRAVQPRKPRTRAVAPRPTRVARAAAEAPVRVEPSAESAAAGRDSAEAPLAPKSGSNRAVPIGSARLRLEAADPLDFPPPSAESASRPAWTPIFSDNPIAVELAASEAARMLALETSVEQLRAESQASRQLMEQMRAQLAESEFNRRLVPWLGAALAIVAVLALWLGLRLRRVQSHAQSQWWASAAAASGDTREGGRGVRAAEAGTPAVARPTSTTRAPAASPPAPAAPVVKAPATADLPPVVARLTETESTGIPPAAPRFDPEASVPGRSHRDVAIDELIDLEQQADFFVVLGQDDAAIDLLLGHVRSSGGQSPMPYMKLLEIYRRKGDRDAYDRLREKFNLRFNAVAPEWDADLHAGRSLDEYPEVFARVTQAWPQPLDALAELESLLFRRESGHAFELPAYRDLLFLYAMARDHLEDATGSASAVDLLLPLGSEPPEPAGLVPGAPDSAWDRAQTVEVGSSSQFAALDLDLEGGAEPDRPDAAPADTPGGRLLDLDLEFRLDESSTPPDDAARPSRR